MTAAGFLRIMLDTARKGCKGNGGRRAVPFAGGCRERVTLLLRGAGGWKPLAVGPGRVIPAVGFKGERPLPCGGVVGAKPPALIGLNIASQRGGCGGVDNILPYSILHLRFSCHKFNTFLKIHAPGFRLEPKYNHPLKYNLHANG